MRIRIVLGSFLLFSISAVQVYAQTAPQFARDHIYGPGGRLAVTVEPDNYPPTAPGSVAVLPDSCPNIGARVYWIAATDIGSGVDHHLVYRDTEFIYQGGSGNGNFHDYIGTEGTYTYSVTAVDKAGHEGPAKADTVTLGPCEEEAALRPGAARSTRLALVIVNGHLTLQLVREPSLFARVVQRIRNEMIAQRRLVFAPRGERHPRTVSAGGGK